MLEQYYIASLEAPSQNVIERRQIQEDEIGLIHAKQAFRYEVVKELPKESDSLNQAFDYAEVFGTLRLAWIDTDLSGKKTTATAVGGLFGFDTASYQGIKLHVGAQTSQKIPFLNPTASQELNPDYYDENGDSFTYIVQASIDYEDETLLARFGRIKIDTPYADSDDIRMAPDTFEGAWVKYSLNDAVVMRGYYLSRWAGYDSGENQQQFKPLFESQDGEASWGGLGASLSYTFNVDNEVSLWYYHFDKMSDIIYGEVAGHYNMSADQHIEYGLQVSDIQELENSNIDGQVIGAMAIFDYKEFFIGLSGNYAFVDEDKSITNGFGGGPYYTSLDESTIGFVSEEAPGVDVLSTRIGVGADLGIIGVEGMTLELVHGQINSTDNREGFHENDIALTYEPDDKISINAVFANYNVDESKNRDDNECFNRFIVRADYNF